MAEVPGVLEIRVHGVSGTPPHAMLGVRPDADVGQVAGDGTTGFYRIRGDAKGSGPPLPSHTGREAYTWGALTSAAGGRLSWLRRAMWLTLLPFALVNVALWSRPDIARHPGKPQYWSAVLVRLAGLLLTALVVVTACGIGIDLVAWQCFRGGNANCPGLPSLMNFLADDPLDEPARRLAIGSLVPLGLLLILWLLTRATIRRYEDYKGPELGGTEGPLLARQRMWQGSERAGSLAKVHLALGLAAIVLATAVPMHHSSGDLSFSIAMWAAGLIAVLTVVTAACGVYDQVEYSTSKLRRIRTFGPLSLLVAAGVLALENTYQLLFPYRRDVDENGDLWGVGATPLLLILALLLVTAMLVGIHRAPRTWPFAVLLALLAPTAWSYFTLEGESRFWTLVAVGAVAAAVGCWWHRWKSAGSTSFAWNGAAPAILVGAAVLVQVLFSTSLTLFAADRLNGGPPVTDLAVRYEPERPERELPDQRPSDRESYPGPGTYLATGEATLERGWVSVVAGAVTVRRGQLEVETLGFDVGSATVGPLPGGEPYVALPSTGLTAGRIAVAGDSLSLRDSCVTMDGASIMRRQAVVVLRDKTLTVAVDPNEPPKICEEGLAAAPVRVAVREDPGAGSLTVPSPYAWCAVFVPPFLLACLMALIAAYLLMRWRTRRDIRNLAGDDYPDSPYADRAVPARTTAAFVHRAESTFGLVALCACLAAVGAAGGALTDTSPVDLGAPRFLGNAGLWASLGLALAMLAVGAKMRTSNSLRRSVGVLWDLSTFWPRAAHPLGPPCYAERVVPELSHRVKWAVEDPEDKVILSGHSQGSTISVAVLWQFVGEGCFSRIYLVSYGSQLRAWFGRVFPDLLGPDVLGNEATARTRLLCAYPDAPPAPPEASTSSAPAGAAGTGPASTAYPMPADHLRVGRARPWWRNLFRRTYPSGSGPGPALTMDRTLAAHLGVGGGDPRWRNLFRRTDPLGFRVYSDSDKDNPVDIYVPEMPAPESGDPNPVVETHSRYPATAPYKTVVGLWLGTSNEGDTSRVSTVPFLPL